MSKMKDVLSEMEELTATVASRGILACDTITKNELVGEDGFIIKFEPSDLTLTTVCCVMILVEGNFILTYVCTDKTTYYSQLHPADSINKEDVAFWVGEALTEQK